MKMPPAADTPKAAISARSEDHGRAFWARPRWAAAPRVARRVARRAFHGNRRRARASRAGARDAAMNYKEVSYAPRGGAVRAPRSYLWVGSAKPHCEGDVSLGPSSR